MRISASAFDLIVSEEVTSKAHYEARLRHTEWPGEKSGVTIGIGYDLGQTDRDKIAQDWRGRVSESMLSSMLSASGVTGAPANSLANSLKASIDIPWDMAIAVHRECVLPRWEAVVERALPNTDRLSPDCFGALVSLTFNRGASFGKDDDRYREMRAIKAHMAEGQFSKIPAEIRAMKRLWAGRGLDGLLKRRDAEATLFERGLSAAPLGPRPTETVPRAPAQPSARVPIASDLAHRIVAAMERKGYEIYRGPGEINIVYVEGMNPDGTPNDDEANKWNDLRLLIRFEGNNPKIIGYWKATTEPGRHWVMNPLDPHGAARIEFGQYNAWQVGMHRGNHEALVQTGGEVTVCRDFNKDFERTGDRRHTGSFGINQHWGYDLPEVGKASAGCLVGQSKTGHKDFMAIVKSDPRYKANRKYVFATTILPESDVLAEGGVAIPPADDVTRPPTDDVTPPPLQDIRDDVRRLQKLLGFSEEGQDGIFGAITEEAVKRFQRRHGLPITGDPDDLTWEMLEREAGILAGGKEQPRPSDVPKQIQKPVETVFGPGGSIMGPFIPIAMQLLPGIIDFIAGDKVGKVAELVTNAVKETTGAKTPEEARDKLNADPAMAMALQLKLAEIANAQEEARQKAQLALLKEQNEQEIKRQQAQLEALKQQSEADAKKREADFQALQAKLDDTKDARASLRALAGGKGWIAATAPILSYGVTLGFFLVLLILLRWGVPETKDNAVLQIINIVIGALVAAFATVVNFWLGSSQGSREKDAASERQTVQQAELIERSAKQNAEVLEKSAKQSAEVLKTVMRSEPAAKVEKPAKQLERCLDIVLKQEAILERSGVTKFGITLEELQSSSLADKNLMELSRDDACEFYRMRYWNVLKCDELPIGVDLVVFDTAADIGLAKSAKLLQDVVGAKDDGSMGPVTMGAVKLMTPLDIVTKLSELRRENKRGSSEGMSRIKEIEDAARQMIAAASAVAV